MSPGAGLAANRWLYKQADVLLGPIEREQLVELLFAGEVDRKTPVAIHGGDLVFRPLGELETFRVHVAKAEAKLRVEAQSAAQDRAERKRSLARVLATVIALCAALFGAGRLAYWLAIHRPWERSIQLPEPVITDELPQIKLASARAGDEELIYPDARTSAGAPHAGKPIASREHDKQAAARGLSHRSSAGQRAPAGSARAVGGEDVQSLQLWDQAAINAVVRANKAALHPCLAAEARRKSGNWSARIPIEFTIGNDGHVTKLWIDNPEYKGEGSELHKCMLAELRRWRFPAYGGEQANVSLAFSVKGR
jgi:hypothetical protein